MPLSDPAIKKAKSEAKPYKLTDEKGLFLLVNAAGKYWRLAYRFGGKQKTLALGSILTFIAIVVGSAVTMKVQYAMMMRAEG